MRAGTSRGSTRTCLPLLSLLLAGGCTIQVGPPGSDQNTPNVPPTTIMVKAINRTDKPLDPQIYVGPATGGLNGLFVAANKRTDFGVGGVGILLPDAEISISVACGEQVLIATRGGIFGDDLTAPDGQGQQFVLDEDLNLYCGDLVTFTFHNDGSELLTGFSVQPLNN
jgi:hypothetical protein